MATSRSVIVVVDGAAIKSATGRGRIAGAAATVLSSAMERLHDLFTNVYGHVEHVYSPCKVGVITQKISNDNLTAIGSVIANTMLTKILDVGDGVLKKRGWVERTTVTNRIAKEVSNAMEAILCCLLFFFSPPSKKQISNPDLVRMPFCCSHHTLVPCHPEHVSGSESISCRPPESPAQRLIAVRQWL